MTAQKFHFIYSHYCLSFGYHNSDYQNIEMKPEKERPSIIFSAALTTGRNATFRFSVIRDEITHQLSAVTPLGNSHNGSFNTRGLRALAISLEDAPAALEQLRAKADEFLRFERTSEDRITEGLQSHLTDLRFMHELDAAGNRYDGADYDPEDDFHKWLIENDFAEVETDDESPEDKTLSLAWDWEDRLTEYFDNYFLGVQIANTPAGDSPCVEADICVGGPTCYLKQFFGRGYVLVYAWGGQSDAYSLDSDLDDWLDDRFCVYC